MLQVLMRGTLRLSAVDFEIAWRGGQRSAAQQNKLYKRGRSELDGYNKASYHQSGRAVDVVAVVNGKPTWEPEAYKEIHRAALVAGQALGVTFEWGGHWKSLVDMTHYQLPDPTAD